jgi:histidinol-phosphate aminotransferase
MREIVPANIKELNAYVPGKTIAEVQQEYKPERISKLASNENRLGHSQFVEQAILEAVNVIHDYPDPAARALKAAIAKSVGCKTSEILVGAGSESLLAGLCRTFFLNKENLITADATFIGIYVQAKIRGIKVKRIPLTKNYGFDLNAIINAIDEQTKMIYIANPNNPTGTYINADEFDKLMKAVSKDVIVVMDEAYFEFASELNDYPDVLSQSYENVIVLRTFSKGYGLAGFRVGYAIGPENLIQYLFKTRLAFEPGSLGQAAALASFGDADFLKKSKELVQKGKKRMYDLLDELGITYAESAANFVMMDVLDEQKAIHLTQKMLEDGVILRRLNAFGLPSCIRVTMGTTAEMNHFEESFRKHLAN